MHSIRVASKTSLRQNKKVWWGIGVCAVASLILLWLVFSPSSERSASLARVQRGDLFQRVTIAGSVEPNKRTLIQAQYAGYIQKLFVKVGDRVKVNDPVVTVTQSLQNSEKAYPLRSPLDGVVVQVERTEGEFVRESTGGSEGVIARIDDLSKLFVWASAPEVDTAKIQVGMETVVRVSAVGEAVYKGVVREIALAAKTMDGWRSRQSTFDIRVEILDPDEQLRPGQSAVVDVVTNRFQNVLYLPIEYVYQEGDRYFVMDRRGRRKDVEVGSQTEMAYEIKSGLKEGDEVQLVDFLKVLEGGS